MANKTLVRVLSAAVMLPLFIFVIIWNGAFYLPLYILLTMAAIKGIHEFYQMTKQKFSSSAKIFFIPLMAAAFTMISIFYLEMLFRLQVINRWWDISHLFILVWLIFFALFLVIAFLQVFFRPLDGAIVSIGLTMFPLFYIVIPLALVLLLRAQRDIGAELIFIAAASAFIADSGAYFAGITLGKHKAGIKVSPNKSVEGFIGGILTNGLGIFLLTKLIASIYGKSFFTSLEAVILGIVLALTGQLGDLIESSWKRDSGVKDSGALIPGHGGVLDLIDATLINIPLVWIYVLIK